MCVDGNTCKVYMLVGVMKGRLFAWVQKEVTIKSTIMAWAQNIAISRPIVQAKAEILTKEFCHNNFRCSQFLAVLVQDENYTVHTTPSFSNLYPNILNPTPKLHPTTPLPFTIHTNIKVQCKTRQAYTALPTLWRQPIGKTHLQETLAISITN